MYPGIAPSRFAFLRVSERPHNQNEASASDDVQQSDTGCAVGYRMLQTKR